MTSAKKIVGSSLSAEIIVMAIAVALIFGACSNKDSASKKGSPDSEPASDMSSASAELSPLKPDSSLGWTKASEAGIGWEIPSGWVVGPAMPMRAGTYFASAADGDSEPAECRVNFFGAGQGGEVDENILRWAGQMEVEGKEGVSPTPIVESAEVSGIPVAVVELSGVYLSQTRPMASEITRKPGFKMFAAIAIAPEGTVFYKMTGPAKTMDANRESFRRMIGSISAEN
jgi:hypothetical protein